MLIVRDKAPLNSYIYIGRLQNPQGDMLQVTAPFNNVRNLKFKSPPTVAFSLPSVNVTEVLENE